MSEGWCKLLTTARQRYINKQVSAFSDQVFKWRDLCSFLHMYLNNEDDNNNNNVLNVATGGNAWFWHATKGNLHNQEWNQFRSSKFNSIDVGPHNYLQRAVKRGSLCWNGFILNTDQIKSNDVIASDLRYICRSFIGSQFFSAQ